MALSLPAPYTSIGGLRSALSTDAKQVLHDAYAATHVAARAQPGSPIPQEPDFVAELVKTGVPALAKAWKPHLAKHGLSIDIVGVFIHQSPMVDFTGPLGAARCELGDLLLAVQFPNVTAPSGVALLAQAKMQKPTGHTTVHSVASSDPDQHHLYSTWPDFGLTHTSHKTIAIRSLGDQGMLGEISRGGPTTSGVTPAATTWMTEDFLAPGPTADLADVLADMAAGTLGRSFSPFVGPRISPPASHPSATSEWDFLIDYLIGVTLSKTYTRTRIGVKGHPRGTIVTALSGSVQSVRGSRA